MSRKTEAHSGTFGHMPIHCDSNEIIVGIYRKGEAATARPVVAKITTYRGVIGLDIREYYLTDTGGVWHPTSKGIRFAPLDERLVPWLRALATRLDAGEEAPIAGQSVE